MTRFDAHDPLMAVIAGSAGDDAAWSGTDLEAKLMRARALEGDLQTLAELVVRPLRRLRKAVDAWNTRRRDQEILAEMETVFRADLGHHRLPPRRPANSDESAERVA